MKLDKHHKNIEEIDVSCQIPVNNHGNTDTDIVTVIGNVKQVRFNNNVYATLIPTKEELKKVYMDYKQHNIDNVVSNINNDFNKLNEEKFNYIENVKIIEPLPESLSVSVNQNKSCIKQRKTNSNNNTDYKYNNRTTIANGKFQFYDDILDYIK